MVCEHRKGVLILSRDSRTIMHRDSGSELGICAPETCLKIWGATCPLDTACIGRDVCGVSWKENPTHFGWILGENTHPPLPWRASSSHVRSKHLPGGHRDNTILFCKQGC